MTNAFDTSKTSLISRTLCSIVWVVITCWLGVAHFIIVWFSSYTLPIVGYTIWGAGCIMMYWLLLWWTGRVYPTWKSWKFGLILQFCLVTLSMASAYFMEDNMFYPFRPLSLLFPLIIFENDNLLLFILRYVIAFAEIAALQALAIVLRHNSDKRKAKKQKNKSIEPPAPPARKDEW